MGHGAGSGGVWRDPVAAAVSAGAEGGQELAARVQAADPGDGPARPDPGRGFMVGPQVGRGGVAGKFDPVAGVQHQAAASPFYGQECPREAVGQAAGPGGAVHGADRARGPAHQRRRGVLIHQTRTELLGLAGEVRDFAREAAGAVEVMDAGIGEAEADFGEDCGPGGAHVRAGAAMPAGLAGRADGVLLDRPAGRHRAAVDVAQACSIDRIAVSRPTIGRA